MLRYRIAQDLSGRHFVLSALPAIVPLDETYATRDAAQETADFLNRLRGRNDELAKAAHPA